MESMWIVRLSNAGLLPRISMRRLLSSRSNHFVLSDIASLYPSLRSLPRQQARKDHTTSSSQICSNPDSQYEDFYRYTSGRWVWDEEQQLRDRFRKFNVPELQRIAASCVGARVCITMTKLGEGSFNNVFRLVMDNGKIAIARIPNPNAGPECYTTASEVATMDFVRMPESQADLYTQSVQYSC